MMRFRPSMGRHGHHCNAQFIIIINININTNTNININTNINTNTMLTAEILRMYVKLGHVTIWLEKYFLKFKLCSELFF